KYPGAATRGPPADADRTGPGGRRTGAPGVGGRRRLRHRGRGELLHDDQAAGPLQLLHLEGGRHRGAALRPGARALRRRRSLPARYAGMGDNVMGGVSDRSRHELRAARAILLVGGVLAGAVALAHDPSPDPARTEAWTPVPAV